MSSPAGRMTMHMLAAFAEFEGGLIRERTSAGLRQARAEGRVGGRRSELSAAQRAEIVESVMSGTRTAANMARLYGVSLSNRFADRGRDAATMNRRFRSVIAFRPIFAPTSNRTCVPWYQCLSTTIERGFQWSRLRRRMGFLFCGFALADQVGGSDGTGPHHRRDQRPLDDPLRKAAQSLSTHEYGETPAVRYELAANPRRSKRSGRGQRSLKRRYRMVRFEDAGVSRSR